MTKNLLLALLVFALMVNMAWGEGHFETRNKLNLDMKQSVSGQGYFMNYKYARMPNLLGAFNSTTDNGVEAKDYNHGSGTINGDSLLTAESSNYKYGVNESYGQDYQEALSCIQFKEDNSMVYSPQVLTFGTGYYAVKPLVFNSLIKEKTWLKNRGSQTSMHHEVEYAHALDKELELTAKDFISEDDPAVSMMNITEDVTAGRAHIGLLQGDPSKVLKEEEKEHRAVGAFTEVEDFGAPTGSALRSPLVLVDEDYWGTYHIEKYMNLTASVEETDEDDDWLPCCSGGYLTMPEAYQMGVKGFGSDVRGIFDCTCHAVSNQAEFPRIYA